jgi:hypothetical protein
MVFIFWVENLEKGELNHHFLEKGIKWNLFTTFSKFLSTFSPIFLVFEKIFTSQGERNPFSFEKLFERQ